MEILNYKGYFTEIHFSKEDRILYGKIEGILDLINFESDSASEIEAEFHNAVDYYLEFCGRVGKTPEKPFKGSFNVRVAPELHRAAYLAAKKEGKSLNSLVETSIENYIYKNNIIQTINIYQNQQAVASQTSILNENWFTNTTLIEESVWKN